MLRASVLGGKTKAGPGTVNNNVLGNFHINHMSCAESCLSLWRGVIRNICVHGYYHILSEAAVLGGLWDWNVGIGEIIQPCLVSQRYLQGNLWNARACEQILGLV